MPCRGAFEIGDLAFNPHIDEPALEHFPNLEAQFGNGVDLSLKFRVFHKRQYSLSIV
jgi:hypothetical protein